MFDEQAADLMTVAGSSPGGAGEIARYNIACAYALASKTGTPDVREERAARAVRELTALAKAGYFKAPARVAHVRRDTDLVPLHGRPDYAAFEAVLAAGK